MVGSQRVVAVAVRTKVLSDTVGRVDTRRAGDLSTDKSVGFPGFIAELCFLTVFPSEGSIELTAVGVADTVWLPCPSGRKTGEGGAGGNVEVAQGIIGLFNGFVVIPPVLQS